MERSTIFNGKTHYFDWAIFHSYVTNYQKVTQIFVKMDRWTEVSTPSLAVSELNCQLKSFDALLRKDCCLTSRHRRQQTMTPWLKGRILKRGGKMNWNQGTFHQKSTSEDLLVELEKETNKCKLCLLNQRDKGMKPDSTVPCQSSHRQTISPR